MKSKLILLNRSSETGSALILILIAVALFGALSFTVTQMLREGNPQKMSQEKSRLYAQELMSYAHNLREAVQGMQISNGCADTDISFENSTLAGYEHTPATRVPCRVFNEQGGGLSYIPPSTDWLDKAQSAQVLYGKIYVAGNICVPSVGAGATSSCAADGENNEEIILFVPFVRREVCIELNNLIGGAEDDSPPPQETGNGWGGAAPLYKGVPADGISLDQDKIMQGCFEGAAASTPNNGSYHFFQVLVAR